MFKDLDPLLHSQIRLGIMSILVGVDSAEFAFLKEQTGATAGNLSVQVSKLKDAGYITVKKRFNNNYPQTICKIAPKGADAFKDYVNALSTYLKNGYNDEQA